MPDDATALIAQGIKPVAPQAPDVIGSISALSQLAYSQANADRARAETEQIHQNTQFTSGKLGALDQYRALTGGGMNPEEATIKSGLSVYDPQGVNATMGNIKAARDIGAIRGYNPNDPNSVAKGGPEMVSQASSALNTQALTREKNLENMKAVAMLTGHLGNMILADPSPEGRQRVLAMAHTMAPQLGVNATQIDKAARLPDDQWVMLGKELQAAGQNAETYLKTSGGETYNQGVAKAATSMEKVSPGEKVIYGPGSAAAVTGAPVPAFAQPGMTPGAPTSAPLARKSTDPGAIKPAAGPVTSDQVSRAILGQESGGNPNVRDSVDGAKGMGQIMPATFKQYAKPGENINNPADNLAVHQRIIQDYSQRYNGDPRRIAVAYFSGPGNVASPENPTPWIRNVRDGGGTSTASYVAGIMSRLNGGGGPIGTPSATIVRGGTPDIAPGMEAPLVGTTPPAVLIGPAITGGTFGTPPAPSPSPPAPLATTPPAPPATPAPRAPEAAPSMPTITNPGGGKPVPTGTAADAAAPLLKAGPGGSMVAEGLSLSAAEEQRGTGEGYSKLPQKLAEAADAARQQNTIISELSQSTDGWRQGKFADWEQEGREILQAAAKTLGVSSPNLDKATGNYQDFVKLAGNLVRTAVHETTARSGVQEMQMITRQLPSPEMTQYGLNLIFGQLQGLNDFTSAKQQAATAWKAEHGTLGPGPKTAGMDFQTFWNKNASIMPFAVQRIGQQNPEALKAVLDNMSKSKEGIAELKKIKADREWAIANGLLQ